MIRFTVEAQTFEEIVKNLNDMIDRMTSLEVLEINTNYKLTYSMLWKKMQEYDLEIGPLASSELLLREYSATSISDLPLDQWASFYKELDSQIEEKHFDEMAVDLSKELAW